MRCLIIGSSVVDVFVSLASKDHVSISSNTATFHLGDKVPVTIQEFALGGNGMNVAIGLTRLGCDSSFYTYLGTDKLSGEFEDTLKKERIPLLVEREEGTSSLSYILDFDSDRIIFSHHPARDHSFQAPEETYDLVVISSIGTRWEDAYAKALAYAQRTNTPIVLTPGSKQFDEMNETFFSVLHASKYLFLNREEAQMIAKQFSIHVTEIKDLLTELKKLGPEFVSITDGGNGAAALSPDNEMYSITPINHTQTTEKTGAGDAYAAGVLAGFFITKSLPEAMRWGILNAYSVMEKTGAQSGLLTREGLDQLISQHKDLVAIPVV